MITLAIIGVVAALTIPPLVRNYNEYITVNKVKKFYSMIGQAIKLSVVDNDEISSWHISDGPWSSQNATEIAKYITPYLKIRKVCGTSSGCIDYSKGIKKLNGKVYGRNFDTDNKFYKIVLVDKSYVWFAGPDGGKYCQYTDRAVNNVCGYVYIDINGSKKPNIIGQDIFAIVLTTNGVSQHSLDDCTKQSTGWGCINYIIRNNNLNYLK